MNLSSLGQQGVRVVVVTGATAILACLPELRAAAQEWDQVTELAELPYLLSVPVVPERRPLLVLLRRARSPAAQTGEPHGELLGAVLLFAYAARWLGERLLANPDRSGRRCVFSAAHDRTSVAVIASRAMLERGAFSVRLHYRAREESGEGGQRDPGQLRQQTAIAALHMLHTEAVRYELRSGVRPMELPLQRELEETLRRVGKRTRRNLRHSTRQSENDMGAVFVLDPVISMEELERLNAACTHPVRKGVLRWRHRLLEQVPGAFLAGLRTAEGEWMGVAGGRQVGDAVVLDWQMNVKRFAAYSVSLVMRGHLMASFGRQGVGSMRIEGGTIHALVNAFRSATVYTLKMNRPSLTMRVLERGMTTWFPRRAMTRTLFGGAAALSRHVARKTGN